MGFHHIAESEFYRAEKTDVVILSIAVIVVAVKVVVALLAIKVK